MKTGIYTTYLKKILKLILRARRRSGSAVYTSPLLVNLEKVKLGSLEKPFVSIHVAVFNEKKVVERLIQSCTRQDWYGWEGREGQEGREGKSSQPSVPSGPAAYELVIVDDSTDETTEIAKQTLVASGWQMALPSSGQATNSDTGSESDPVSEGEGAEVFVFTPLRPAKPDSEGQAKPVVKLIHRSSRSGFKGGALQVALENTEARAQYIVVLDADFVPYPDTIEQFVKTFQVLNANHSSDTGSSISDPVSERTGSNIAAVQGYQWHVLNKSQNWITRGVRTEYAGSYVIERSTEELYGGLKQIAGSVYCIRADVLRKFGWGTSITEDFELTLRLYEAGYKVVFTPYIQVPAEAVSTIKRLIRQRMRWAEGSSFNIKVMFARMVFGRWETDGGEPLSTPGVSQNSDTGSESDPVSEESDNAVDSRFRGNDKGEGNGKEGRVWVPSPLTRAEKLEFAYFAFYYLQAAFFVVGTFAWFVSETIFHARLPFWTAALGWSLVFTNLLALPLMNIIGLFLEESDERDYAGIISFIALSYIVVPFQAYAAIKGFLEPVEGPWFRTPKTGLITDTFGRSQFGKFFGNLFGKPAVSIQIPDLKKQIRYLKEENWRLAFASVASNAATRSKFRLRARTVLAVLLIFTLTVNYFALNTPETYATNRGTNYGQYTDVYCPTATDCKISYYDVTNADLRMADCDNATCSSGGDRAIDEGGDVGQYTSIYCIASDNCKISYYDVTNGDLKFRDCDNATCDSGTTTLLDGRTGCTLTSCSTTANVGQYTSIYCVADDNCKISYSDVTNGDLKMADCDSATCSSGTATTVDATAGETVGQWTSIYCISDTDCKMSHHDNTSGAMQLKFADCGNATCSTNTLSVTDVDMNTATYTSVYCPATDDCKVSEYYQDAVSANQLVFVDCNDAACDGTGETYTTLDGGTTCVLTGCDGDGNAIGQYTSIYCISATDCKVSYYAQQAAIQDLKFADCDNATCGTGNVSAVDTGGNVGQWTGLYCSATDDCKISYYDVTNGDLKFVDCGQTSCNATGRTITTVALTVPELVGFLIPVAPFLPKIVKKLKTFKPKGRKAKVKAK